MTVSSRDGAVEAVKRSSSRDRAVEIEQHIQCTQERTVVTVSSRDVAVEAVKRSSSTCNLDINKHALEAHIELCNVLRDFGSDSLAIGSLPFLNCLWWVSAAPGEVRRLDDVPLACLTFV